MQILFVLLRRLKKGWEPRDGHLGVAEGRDIEVGGEGDSAFDLGQAAAHVLLEALQVQRQHLRRPDHTHNYYYKRSVNSEKLPDMLHAP